MRKILSLFMATLCSVVMWAADTYYYRGNQNGWKASEMTESTDGFYAYFEAKGYSNNGNSNNNFKVSKTADSWDYNNGYATRGFNGTDIQNTEGDKSIGLNWSDDNICVYCTVDFYILVYYPNTIINNTSKPVVCASTTLPEGALYIAGDGWCGTEWNTTDEANKMTWNKAKGIFTKTINGVSAADHKFKVSTYNWGTAYGHDAYDAASSKNVVSCSADDGNVKFQPAMEGTVTVTIDAATKKISVVCQTPVVTFDKEGGDKGSASVEAEYGVAATAITIPEKANYDFKGYYTEDNGTGTAVINADGSWKSSVENYTDKDGKWIARANSTLYAKWEGKNYAITYKDENNAAYSGSNSEALPSSYQYGAGVSLVNGIKADHQFLGWYDNATCTGEAITAIAADATGAKTFYAQWKEIDGGSVTLLAGEGGEVSADKSVWGANAMIADIKANSDVAIYARPNTGYSFDQWTKVSGEGAIKTNAATGEFSAVAYQNASVSASFRENKVAIEPTVHFDAGTAAYTAEASVAAIGIATTTELSASAATEGFAFAGWTLSSNLVVVSGNAAKDLSITVRTNGDGDAVSAVANYNEDLSTPFVLNGGAAFGETAWKQALPLKKKSGHSTEKIAYITISNLAPVGEADNAAYYFKIVDDENKWYGLPAEGDSYWFLRTTEEQTLADAKNIQLRADKAGNYEIKVDYSTAALKISIAFPEQVSSDVTVTAPEHGTITVKDGEATIGTKVQEGTILTVTAAPKDAAAYHIYNLRAYKTGEPATTVEIKNGQLTMPAYPITIIADEKAIVLKDLLFVPGKWAEEKAKIAAWIWTRKDGHAMADQWTAFFAPKSAGNDTLSVKLDADADSIVFVRFNKTAEAPSWEDKEDFRWNSLAGDTIDKYDLTYTITGWNEGTWDPYIPAKYYITGNAALVAYAGLAEESAWNAKAIKVIKDTFVFENLAAGYYLMKVVTKDAEPQWIGYDRLTEKSKGLLDAEDHQIGFTMEQAGNVTVVYKEGVFVVKGDYAKLPKVGLAANFNSWNWAENLLVPAKDSLSASLKVNLGVTDTIRFKMVSDGNWLSLNGEGESEYGIHRTWPSAAHVNIVDGRNFALTTDKEGEYTFTWTYADSTLTVKFPELVSYDVTVTNPAHGTITVMNGEDAISAPVQEGTVLTVTAAANDAAVYEIKNLRAYKTGDKGVEVAITDGKLIMPAYPITITADEEKIVYQTIYFVDKEGWNGVNAYVFIDDDHKYKVWPGEAMKEEDRKVKEKDLYSYTFPAKYTTIIFNKKDETTTQTKDMLWSAATPYYCNGFWYASEEAVVLDATAKYYITGDKAIMGAGDPAAIKVAEDSYTFPNLPAGTYRMKITLEGTWEEGKVKGYSHLTVKDPSFDTNSENDIIFKLNEAGDVTVTYNATTFTVTGKFAQKEYYIAGTFTDWKDNMVKMAKKDDKYAATIEIKATEVQEFKVVYVFGADSVWYGLENPATMTSADGEWGIGGGEANIGLQPTKAGNYTFTFNPEVPSLTVEMPAQGGGTALDNIRATEKAQKVIINGQLYILYNERMYNVQGQTVK